VDVLAAQVVVLELQCLEEVPQTVRALQQRQIVVLNLIQLNAEQAQRAVDFVAGAVYFLQGNQQRLGAAMFLLTPQYVQLSTADWQMQSEGVRQS
jgi:cell division inhibitor SepF